MYGNITASGMLIIERGIEKIYQICPYGQQKNCGHHCPLFLEEDGRVYPCGNKSIAVDIMQDDRYVKRMENETNEQD